MDIVVRGRGRDVPERFRSHVADKLARLEKFEHLPLRVDVELLREHNPRLSDLSERVEITAHSRGPVIRAEAAADDPYAALDLAYGKIEARLRKMADRRRVHHGRQRPVSVSEATAALAADAVAGPRGSSPSDRSALSTAERGAGDGAAASFAESAEVEDSPMVVREKSHQAVPMTLDQALYEMELVGHDFYLFVDETSRQPSVVYRRRGYDYGVIRLTLTVS